MDAPLERRVRERARGRCEYCQLPEAFSTLPFQVDHIIARKHGGATEPGNLALACFYCNTHKGPNIAGRHRDTAEIVRLFNPRTDEWAEHFKWNGPTLTGLTAIGGVTVDVLAINRPEFVTLRESLIAGGSFPPRVD